MRVAKIRPSRRRLGKSFFLLHSLYNLDFGCDGSVVGTGHPKGFVSAHSLETNYDILQSFVESVSHMKLPRDIGRWHHNRERLFFGIGMGFEKLALQPHIVDAFLKFRIVRFVHILHAVYLLAPKARLYSIIKTFREGVAVSEQDFSKENQPS